jgi:hypothetical protein
MSSSGVPLEANYVNQQQPSPLEAYGKIMQLKSLMQGQQLQQAQLAGEQQQQKQSSQLFPGQLQQQQLQTQQAQNKVASQQAIMKAWSDPDFAKQITGSQQQGQSANRPGFDPNAMMSTLMSGKYGKVLPEDAQGIVSGFLDRSVKASEYAKNNSQAASDQLGTYQKSLGQVTDKLSSILSMPAAQALPAFEAYKQELAKNPIPGMPQGDLQMLQSSTLDKLPAFINMGKVESNIAGYHKDEADAQLAQTNAQKSKMELPGGAMNPVTQHIQEETDPRVIAAHAQQAAQSQEAVQKGLYGDSPLASVPPALAPAATAAATKLGTDYASFSGQIQNLKAQLSAAKTGDQVASAFAPIATALGSNAFYGTHRLAPSEVDALGPGLGSVGRELNTWFDKHATGTLAPDSVKEFNALVDRLTDAKSTSYKQGLEVVNKNYGSKFSPVGDTGGSQQQSSTPAKDLGAAPQGAKEGDTGKFNGVPAKIINGRIVTQ